jgi:hypothetical protein
MRCMVSTLQETRCKAFALTPRKMDTRNGGTRQRLSHQLSETSPDMTCLAELAKVQIRRIHHNRYQVPDWIHQQVYLNPYRKELMLRNHV